MACRALRESRSAWAAGPSVEPAEEAPCGASPLALFVRPAASLTLGASLGGRRAAGASSASEEGSSGSVVSSSGLRFAAASPASRDGGRRRRGRASLRSRRGSSPSSPSSSRGGARASGSRGSARRSGASLALALAAPPAVARVLESIGGVLRDSLDRLRASPTTTRRLIAGGISGAISKTATAPLETLKMQLVQGGKVTVWEAAGRVLRQGGIGGFFAGNSIDVLRTIPSRSMELAAFDTYKKLLSSSGLVPAASVGAIAGGAAGITSTVGVYPLETLRTRMAVHGLGFMGAVRRIPQDGGFLGLYKGLDASLVGGVPYAAIRLGLYDALKYSYCKATGKEENQIDPQAALVFGAIAGVVSASATFPLEVARRRMMVGAAYPNTAAAIATIAREEGVGALFNGVWLSVVKQAPQYAIGFAVYERCKQILLL